MVTGHKKANMKDISSSVGLYVSLEPDSRMEEGQSDDDDDINLEDICEVVLSLKCKHCQFLCNDRTTLALHVKQTHVSVSKKGSKSNNNAKRKGARETEKDERKSASVQEPVTQPSNGNNDGLSTASTTIESENESSKKSTKSTNSSSLLTIDIDKEGSSESNLMILATAASTENQKTFNASSASIEGLSDESVEDVFLCAECDIVFSSREMCCSHMHKVHGLKQFSADFIQEEIIQKKPKDEQPQNSGSRKTKLPKEFTTESGSVVPKRYRVTKNIFYTCSRCPVKFDSVEVMMFHEQCHLTSEADKNTRAGKDKQHTSTIPEIEIKPLKGFRCPVCESKGSDSQLFPKWSACSWHLWKEHRIDCELHTCSICKQFKSHLIGRVKDHEQLHSAKASYKCKTCNKTFKQLKQLRCHEKYHKDNSTKLPPPSDSRWYTPKECPICKRILSDSKCLKKHISAVHNKLKPYVCNICGHTSARKAELQLHQRQHTGEKPYKCPICSYQTGDHNSLRKHKLRHSDERPYACPYCDYRCIQSCAFKKHIISCHPGQEVVYICQLCSHKSVNETLFAAHQKDHAEGRISSDNQDEMPSSTVVSDQNSSRNHSSTNLSGGTLAEDGTANNYWSEDDNESIDIIDNGGVTIPASPQSNDSDNCIAEASPMDVKTDQLENLVRSSSPTEPHTMSNTCGSSSTSSATSKLEDGSLLQLESPSDFGAFKGAQPLEKHGRASDSNKVKPVPFHQSTITTPPYLCVTASLQSLPSTASHRHPASNAIPVSIATIVSPSHPPQQHQDIRGNEDTESTSEVITNPHKLIENIQLTPLDLTDIIACNEQSNDDGMLQRLLDMSGV
ncbi:putative zinc finger protein [Orchesella cincta]|uniref:Putative zinc finger protein n=1 Tax=Orchesella cincta TaxID=48709 RepID=A0A1D2NC47_ORCCI|nr:putative zinc finger protein [Orchesella cincta]